MSIGPCVDCGKPLPTPTPNPFRCPSCAMDKRLKEGWTPQDRSREGFWFFPSSRCIWQESNAYYPAKINAAGDRVILAAHPDAVHLTTSGCPKCLVGYADIMSDPTFHCDVCDGTGFPVFGNE